MLTQIDVVYGDETGEQALALPILGVTPKDSLLVRKVTGLNPPDTDLFIGEYARDGGTYQGRRVGNRNVVLTIDLNPNPALGETVSGLRDLLYKTFMDPLVDADHIELVLHSEDDRIRNIYGYTEKFETELFEIETMVQISLICPDPYIRDLTETVVENETDTWTSIPFAYRGTAETGFEINVIITQATPTLKLSLNGRVMTINRSFEIGDNITINTVRGERNITFYPLGGGENVSLLPFLSMNSRWLEIHSPSNIFQVGGVTMADVVAGIKSFRYRASYWGV